MAMPIIARIERGRLHFQIHNVPFAGFLKAERIRSATKAPQSHPHLGQSCHSVDIRCPAFVA